MRKLLPVLVALVLCLTLRSAPGAGAEQYPPDYYQVANQWGYELLSPEALDELLAPIALYPDPLIAQILPAATFTEQIAVAARHVRRYGTARVDYQPWDLSVRAIAHYPKLLYMMERDYDWTVSLGQAFIDQPQDVMDAVQRLRDYAWAQGNLYSTREQEVIYEAGFVRIVPARPQYVYIPVYDPYAVYVERYTPSYPFVTFSVGFTIGAWLNRDCDWRDRRVYYHGWRGSRWVDRARPHIRDRRGVYITPRASVINVNTRVVERDTRSYRQQLRTEGVRRREGGRLPAVRTERPRPGRIERPLPGRVEPRARTTEPRPGIVEQPRTGTTQQQRPARVEPLRQRPGVVEQPGAGRLQQPRPGKVDTPRGTVEQPRTGVRQQGPAATGQQGRPAREGQGEGRRRELRQINRPTAPQTPAVTPRPPASPQAPARVLETPSRTIVVPSRPSVTPSPAPTIIQTPRPSVVPTPAPTIIQPPRPSVTPAPTVTPSPRGAEPAPPARGRDVSPDSGRERLDGSSPRATPREGR